jgi:hypothetical protein
MKIPKDICESHMRFLVHSQVFAMRPSQSAILRIVIILVEILDGRLTD